MNILPGIIYQHKKGGKYLVLHIVKEATNARGQSQGVVYVSLENGQIFYRDLSEFCEVVEWSDGKKRARFVPRDQIDI